MRYYNRTEWYLRLVPAPKRPGSVEDHFIAQANLTQVFPRPNELYGIRSVILREVERRLSAPFNMFRIITPQYLLCMYIRVSSPGFWTPPNYDVRSESAFPESTVKDGKRIFLDLVNTPPARIRQILGDPLHNVIALDARMAFLFHSLLLNATKVASELDVHENDYDDPAEERVIYRELAAERREFGQRDIYALLSVDMQAMTIQEALQLRQLFRHCMDPHSSIFRATNVTLSRLRSTLQTLYPNSPGTSRAHAASSNFYPHMDVFNPPRPTSVWEYSFQRILASFRLCYMLLEVVLWDARQRLKYGRSSAFLQ